MVNLFKFSFVTFFCLSSQAYAVVAPLLAAVIANDARAVARLLNQGANPNVAVEDLTGLPEDVDLGDTSLHIAARRGNIRIARILIQSSRNRVEISRIQEQETRKRLLLQRCAFRYTSFSRSMVFGSSAGVLGGPHFPFPPSPRRSATCLSSRESLVVVERAIPLILNAQNAHGLVPMHEAILGGFVQMVNLLGGAGGAQGVPILNFEEHQVPPAFVPALVAALPFFAPHLQVINLNNIHIEGAGPAHLFGPTPAQEANLAAFVALGGLQFPQLIELHLAGLGFGAVQMAAFQGFLGAVLPQLQVLDLANNAFGDNGAVQLAAIFEANPPEHLINFIIHSNGITGPGINAMAELLQVLAVHNTLVNFDFSGNELEMGGLADFVPALVVQGALTHLDLGHTNLGYLEPGSIEAQEEELEDLESNAEALFGLMLGLNNLQDLILNDNQLGMPFLEGLANLLAHPNQNILPNLVNLNLVGNFDGLSDAERGILNELLNRIRARRPGLNIILN